MTNKTIGVGIMGGSIKDGRRMHTYPLKQLEAVSTTNLASAQAAAEAFSAEQRAGPGKLSRSGLGGSFGKSGMPF